MPPPPLAEMWQLWPAECYHYLNQSGVDAVSGVDVAREYSDLKVGASLIVARC